MNATILKPLLDEVLSWPPEDQEELAEAAREIRARRTGVYVLSAEERDAIEEGLEDARRGNFASDDEVDAILNRARRPPQ